MVKFSVLLPTRNRLEYLKFAVESVLGQNYSNWEIIISDNCSEQDVLGYVEGLNDSRIKYVRTAAFIPVTDNWNNALAYATGDYIIMLGDDDCLMENYFSHCLGLIQKYEQPDLIYSCALMYGYPGVFPNKPNGCLHYWGSASFLENKKEPFLLPSSEAKKLVKETMGMRVMFNFNMQFGLFSREIVNRLQNYGNFFQSSYPDYYAMTVLMLTSRKIVAVPYPLVIIGVTPKSFGYYFFNNKETEGVNFLNNYPDQKLVKKLRKYLLPGPEMNNFWLFAMKTVQKNFGWRYFLRINYYNYRLIQLLSYFRHFAAEKKFDEAMLSQITGKLYWWEKLLYLKILRFLTKLVIKTPSHIVNLNYHQEITKLSHPLFTIKEIEGEYLNAMEVVNKVKIETCRAG